MKQGESIFLYIAPGLGAISVAVGIHMEPNRAVGLYVVSAVTCALADKDVKKNVDTASVQSFMLYRSSKLKFAKGKTQ